MPNAKQLAAALAAKSTASDLDRQCKALDRMLEALAVTPEKTPSIITVVELSRAIGRICTEDELKAVRQLVNDILDTMTDLEDAAVNDPFEQPRRLYATGLEE